MYAATADVRRLSSSWDAVLLCLLMASCASFCHAFVVVTSPATVQSTATATATSLAAWSGGSNYLDQLKLNPERTVNEYNLNGQEYGNVNQYYYDANGAVNGDVNEAFNGATTTTTTTTTSFSGENSNSIVDACAMIQQQQQQVQQQLHNLQQLQQMQLQQQSTTMPVHQDTVNEYQQDSTATYNNPQVYSNAYANDNNFQMQQMESQNNGYSTTTVAAATYAAPSTSNSYDAQYQQYYQTPMQQNNGNAAPADATYTSGSSNGMTDWTATAQNTNINGMNVEQNFPLDKTTSNNRFLLEQQQEEDDELSESQQDEQLSRDELENRFLQMMATEVSVKRFLGQNPYAITDVPVGVIFSKWLDNIEDAVIQLKNKNAESFKQERPTVVVLGSGWAAHAFVKIASNFDLKVIVVSPVNHFVFTPMLASAAVGTVEYRSMTESIRAANPNIDNYIEGKAIGIDVQNKVLTLQLPFSSAASNPRFDTKNNGDVFQLPYDYLLCAVGTGVKSSMVPGAQKYCFNLKTSQDSKLLRTAIGEALEYASRPDVQNDFFWKDDDQEHQEARRQERKRRVRFVIIGGGPTGVELSGELNDFLEEICRPKEGAYQRLADDVSVVLVHGGADLLPQFDPVLRQRALQALEKRGVEVRLNTRTTEVGETFVKLKKKGDNTEEEVIPCGLTVWAAGNEPAPFVKELLSQLPESAAGTAGRVNVDTWLRCPTPTPETFGSILVLGDAACLTGTNEQGEAVDMSLPQTAQVAGQQGAFAARLLNRGYDMTKTPPRLPESMPYDKFSKLRVWLLVRGLEEAPDFTFLNLGLLAYVGGGEALTQVQIGDVPLFNLAGKRAFALWRSVYLAKQAATRNQAQLVFDWARTQVFGRDTTRL